MLGRDHMLSGAAAYAALGTCVWHQPPLILLTGTALAGGAAVLSDADTRGSCVARSFGWMSEGLAWVVHKVSGGHREGTHTAVGDAICALLAVAAIALEGWHVRIHHGSAGITLAPGKIFLAAYLALLFGGGLKALRHPRRDRRREILAVAGAAAMTWAGWDTGGIAWAILLGTVVHAAGDSITEHGVPWAEPFSHHRFHLLPKRLLISTGHFTEHWIISPALVIALGLLAWHDAGTLAIAPHVRTAIGAP